MSAVDVSPERVKTLLEIMQHGWSTPGGGRGRMRIVDFSQPTKFTADHQRRIVRASDAFCQGAATRLSADLRTPIEMEVAGSLQLAWSAAQAHLPPNPIGVTLSVKPIDTRILLTVEQAFVTMALDCLLGGTPDAFASERRLSEIDWALTRRLLEATVSQLSVAWHDLGELEVEVADIDLHNDANRVAAPSEPTLVVQLGSRVHNHSFQLALLVPWVAIEPRAERIAGHDFGSSAGGSEAAGLIERTLSAAPVSLRAEVAALELSAEEILSLEPGQVLRLGAKMEDGVTLFVENVKLARVKPGCNGRRRAVQIVAPEVEAV